MATNYLASLVGAVSRALSPKASVGTAESGFFSRWGWESKSWSGKSVNVDSVLQLSTGSACVRLISETIATLPFGFYERRADGSRESASSHSLFNVLHNQPNSDMTAVVFWEVVVASMLLWGNAYIEIQRIGSRVVGLGFLMPNCVSVGINSRGFIEYTYQSPGKAPRTIAAADMMHIPAFSTDGFTGLSPIQYAKNIFGTALATDEASSDTFKHAMRSPGLVTMDAVLQPGQRDDIREHVKKVAASGGVMVLEKGSAFQQLAFNPHDSELLASRSFNVEEIARWFRVDPSMIGHGGKDSNWGTGLEQKMMWFLTFTLRPWCVRIEQAVRRSLLTPLERTRYFAEFAIEGLLRADSATRAEFFSKMVNNGIYTRDYCRQLENLMPMGGNAAVLTVQSALLPLDKLGEAVVPIKETP